MGLFVFGLAFMALQCPPKAGKGPTKGPEVAPFVEGYVATAVARPGSQTIELTHVTAKVPGHDIYLPGVEVFSENLVTGDKTKAVSTDLSGRFTLPAFKTGRYRVCWKAHGFVPDCSPSVYPVSAAPVHLGTLRISVDRQPKTTVVYGQVRMADGSLPRLLEPLANINAFARVELLDKNRNSLYTAYVNNFGEYLLPQVPAQEEITLRAKIEGAATDQPIHPEANLGGAPFQPVNLEIANHPPRLDALVATGSGGRRVYGAKPGDTVNLAARAFDSDGDPIQYRWQVSEGSGTLTSVSGAQVKWTLPNRDALASLTLIAYDGKGGYSMMPLILHVDTRGIIFSGTVFSNSGGVVAGAEAAVNGQRATTDAAGFFRLHVKDTGRFVLNIRKPGFGLFSQVYDRGVAGGQWALTRATVVTVDPMQTITVTDQRRPNECPGPAGARLNWDIYPQLAQAQWQDGKGNVVLPFGKLEVPLPVNLRRNLSYIKERGCGPGITVRIPANSLQDEAGNPPVGNVEVSLSTVDLTSPDQMPGDYTVQLPSGETRVMQSYGAGGVEVTEGGRRYNLKAGAQAEVTIPVDPSQLAVGAPLPPSIPLLFYDESKGVWIPEGTATLVGNAYVAKVSHFSEINTDTVKVNQSCVVVKSPNPPMPPFYKLEVTLPMGGGAAPKVLTRDINNAPPSEHVIYNLPSGVNIVLVPYDSVTSVPVGTFVVNTGGAQNPTVPNLPAGPPYTACATTVTLAPQALPQAPTVANLEFLKGLFSFEASNLNELQAGNANQQQLAQDLGQATTNYYQQIDPRTKRLTLDGFRTTNGMSLNPSAPAAGEVRAIYANSGDLGFGRDMHCKKQLASDGLLDVACYVTNYGDILTKDTDDVAAAVAGTNPGATVAMEYSRIESPQGNIPEFDDPQRVVKFYVYVGNQREPSADLDSGFNTRKRPIPQLCMVCHGGRYPSGPTVGAPSFPNRDSVKLGSVFLPFDLHYYTFAAAPFDKPTQQAAFKTLNQDIVSASNPTAAILEVITKLYAGVNPNEQDENFVVVGWSATQDKQVLYRDVVARACRTCHIANPIQTLRFANDSEIILDTTVNPPVPRLGQVQLRVCSQHVMPHAKRTHDLFWTSIGPHQPAQLQAFGDTYAAVQNGWIKNDPNLSCGAFTGGGVTPTSPEYAEVKTLLTNKCSSCHNGDPNSAPGKLVLAGDPYADLFNVNSCELPTTKRVAPGGGNTAVTNSYLVKKISSAPGNLGCNVALCNPFSPPPPGDCGGQMPLGGSLSQAEKDKIITWVNIGAPH